MIERISELPWASFEKQLYQKCHLYGYDSAQQFQIPDEDGDGVSDAGDEVRKKYWEYYTKSNPLGSQDSDGVGPDGNPILVEDETSGAFRRDGDETTETLADEAYCIQNQILYNAMALNSEIDEKEMSDSNDRKTDKDIFFWYDLFQDVEGNRKHDGWENTEEGRSQQMQDELFTLNKSFEDTRVSTQDDEPDEVESDLTNLPKTHAALSLIEVSEYLGPNNPESEHSNYVSRKVSLLWFFNVIKAIIKTLHTFAWLRVGSSIRKVTCRHKEAENNEHEPNSGVGDHEFWRSTDPKRLGYLRVYGDAIFNGNVSTFHSQARFHDEVRIWDNLNVYGPAYFSKDINGTVMRSRWGDLAEYYSADEDYEPGTLVRFGGTQEVTVANEVANAVVTSNPGLVLNEEMKLKTNGPKHPLGLALVGRVPVKVWGGCCKFDLLVPDPEHPGWSRVQAYPSEQPIARALENKMSEDLVLCATNFKV